MDSESDSGFAASTTNSMRANDSDVEAEFSDSSDFDYTAKPVSSKPTPPDWQLPITRFFAPINSVLSEPANRFPLLCGDNATKDDVCKQRTGQDDKPLQSTDFMDVDMESSGEQYNDFEGVAEVTRRLKLKRHHETLRTSQDNETVKKRRP